MAKAASRRMGADSSIRWEYDHGPRLEHSQNIFPPVTKSPITLGNEWECGIECGFNRRRRRDPFSPKSWLKLPLLFLSSFSASKQSVLLLFFALLLFFFFSSFCLLHFLSFTTSLFLSLFVLKPFIFTHFLYFYFSICFVHLLNPLNLFFISIYSHFSFFPSSFLFPCSLFSIHFL